MQKQFELPNQRVPESKWVEKYYLEHANRMIEFLGNDVLTQRNENIAKFYRRYSCEFNDKEIQANTSLTKMYGHDLGVEYMVYPLCEMVVDQLVGEYISLPMRKKIYSVNKEAINSRLDEKVKHVSEKIFRDINKDLGNELGFEPETENPEIELPDDIDEFFSKTYKTIAEELGDDLIENFLEVRKEKRMIKTLLQDYLIGEQAVVYLGEKDGHPTIERGKYNECYVDLNPNEEIQTDINVFAFFPLYTKNEILNNYNLDKTKLIKVDEIFKKMNDNKLIDQDFTFGTSNNGVDMSGYNNCSKGVSYRNWYDTNSSHRLRVLKMKWKSRKEIRAKVHINRHTGEEVYTLLKANEKPRSRDDVRKISVEVVRYLHMLGPEVMLKFGEDVERITFIDNKKKVQLPVVVLKGRNTMNSSEIRSVVAKIAPLQKMASDILFELRLAIKANDGRVLVYDTAQIPKQFLDTYGQKGAINRMLHHIKKDKILLFNSKDKQSRQTFNQFTALDLSNRGQVKDLIEGLMLIEDLGKKFVGLSKERTGEVGQYQTASGTDRAVLGSNARTEVYFNPFDEFVQSILNVMLMKSKKVYKAGQVFQYIFGDMMTKFLTIYQEFFNSDLGIYLADRFKDKKDKEIIDKAAVQALGNATDKDLILDLVNVLEKDSASESKGVLERSLKAYDKLQAQNAKAAQEAEQAKLQSAQAVQDKKDEVTRDGYINNIEVAKIYADNKTFNESEKLQSEELKTAAKLQTETLNKEKELLAKQKEEAEEPAEK